LTITPEREKNFDFTHAFYTTGLGIAVAVKTHNPWFTVARGVISAAFLKVVASLTLVLLRPVNLTSNKFRYPFVLTDRLRRGWRPRRREKSRLWFMMPPFSPILRYHIHQNYIGILEVLPYRLQRQEYGIALQPNSPLREQINVVLLKKIREKAWQDRLSQYLGK
jgi:ABC-type amino acid transport substrate-binding protein